MIQSLTETDGSAFTTAPLPRHHVSNITREVTLSSPAGALKLVPCDSAQCLSLTQPVYNAAAVSMCDTGADTPQIHEKYQHEHAITLHLTDTTTNDYFHYLP